MEVAANSVIGKQRISNEDYVGYFKNRQGALIAILADGVGEAMVVKLLLQQRLILLDKLFKIIILVQLLIPKHGYLKRLVM